MNEVQVFNSPMFGEVRTAGTPDNPLFCLSDICKALGLKSYHVKERLSKDVVSTDTLLTAGGNQTFTFVNEDGLYDVILDSRKPEAKAFRKWVTSEVLPSIRKSGSFSIQNLSRKELAQMVIQAEEEKERLQIENASMLPKARIYDQVMQTPQTDFLSTTTAVANEIGMSAQKLNKMLCACGIIYKAQSGDYLIAANYLNWNIGQAVSAVIDEVKGVVKTYIKWNTRGRAYIHALYDTNWDKRRAWHLLKDGKEVAAV